jgi:glycosyltransferase involved in cell wall biosynthesis
VSDEEMHALFAAASLVLVPYQRHVGSSGVVVRAAAAGVPVLGPSYGMLGMLIEDRCLGESVDTTRPEELAAGLARFLDPSTPFPFDAEKARAYAAANTEEAMASTLFRFALAERA